MEKTVPDTLPVDPPDPDVIATLSTQDWLDAAKAILIADGVEAVKVDRIARHCGVTRGGFYWRFKNRADLLSQLLETWRRTNTQPLIEALNGPGSVADRFVAGAELWINEEAFDPRFDTAVRTWAHSSPEVAQAVAEIDQQRIAAFHSLFEEAGYRSDEALVRARITYFHQIGYYALHIREVHSDRIKLSRYYYKVLTGLPEFS